MMIILSYLVPNYFLKGPPDQLVSLLASYQTVHLTAVQSVDSCIFVYLENRDSIPSQVPS